jgi:threonylcarbamoyladenosine tRNA methylthiotransferase MtaB
MVSRPILDIVEEGMRLSENGVKELVLAGIQLSSYGRDWGQKVSEPRLAPVIEKLLSLPGIQRVRLSSYAVADFEEALLPLWEKGKGLCAHLHLPLQSGDEGVLRAMRRPYSLEHYQRVVEKIHASAPGIGLTSDIIAGFPGETEEAFENTLRKILEFGFMDFHPFPYSDRPGTPGEVMQPKVNPAVIRERMDRLWALKKECLGFSAQKSKGQTFRVIVEKHGEKHQAGLTDRGLRLIFPKREGFLGRESQVQSLGLMEGMAYAQWVDRVPSGVA